MSFTITPEVNSSQEFIEIAQDFSNPLDLVREGISNGFDAHAKNMRLEFSVIMEYNEQHLPVFEIGYHFEHGISKQGEPVFHYHEYSKPGIENRGKAQPITPALYEKYKKYFKGV